MCMILDIRNLNDNELVFWEQTSHRNSVLRLVYLIGIISLFQSRTKQLPSKDTFACAIIFILESFKRMQYLMAIVILCYSYLTSIKNQRRNWGQNSGFPPSCPINYLGRLQQFIELQVWQNLKSSTLVTNLRLKFLHTICSSGYLGYIRTPAMAT